MRTTIEDSNGDEIELPTKWGICGTCSGNGKHSQHLGAYSQEEFDEAFDPEEAERYFRGDYDTRCDECDGTGKVQVVDESALSPEERIAFRKACADDRAYERECAMERRMGC